MVCLAIPDERAPLEADQTRIGRLQDAAIIGKRTQGCGLRPRCREMRELRDAQASAVRAGGVDQRISHYDRASCATCGG